MIENDETKWIIHKVIKNRNNVIQIPFDDSVWISQNILNSIRKLESGKLVCGKCKICKNSYNTDKNRPIALGCGCILCLECLSMDLYTRKCKECSNIIKDVIPLFI